MDLTYPGFNLLTLQRRIEGLEKEKIIYEFTLDNVGAKVMKTKLMRLFDYSVYGSGTENFIRTRLIKYVRSEVSSTRRLPNGRYTYTYRRYVRNVIWLPKEVVFEHTIKTISQLRWGHVLCFRETVPFWLLKEYGGPYSGREFITEINRRIKETKKQMREINEHDTS